MTQAAEFIAGYSETLTVTGARYLVAPRTANRRLTVPEAAAEWRRANVLPAALATPGGDVTQPRP